MEITEILQAVRSSGHEARVKLIDAAYGDLKRIAGAKMSRERSNHTLSSTALVNEISMSLINDSNMSLENRGQFFAYVAKAMRNHLIDHARRKGRQVRGGDRRQISLSEAITAADEQCDDLLTLNEVLEELSRVDSRRAQVVEMRYFGGMTNVEIAYALDISIATVKRDWDIAKEWLRTRLDVSHG